MWSILIGASGLIGAQIAAQLQVARVHLLLPQRGTKANSTPDRAALPIEAFVAGSAGLPKSWTTTPCTAFISALGTTLRKAGSAKAFVEIDRDLVLNCARRARALGARQAVIVSSVGADAKSRQLYLRVKGEVEIEVSRLGFARCDFLRPGLLIGARAADRRPAEALFQRIAPLLDVGLIGPLRRYRSIDAGVVAAAAVALHTAAEPGVFVHEHDALLALAERVVGNTPV